MTTPAILPAATLVLFRPLPGGPPEVLLVERAGQMAFAGGAMVFPGGRVDPGDRMFAARISADLPLDESAARIAAIRETIEEAGIAIGVSPTPDRDALDEVREALRAGEAFAALAADRRWSVDPAAVVPFARWRPDSKLRRMFDTRFYAAEVPPGTEAWADGGESVNAVWITAADALAEAEANRFRLIYPTRRNLERIAAHPDFMSFAADAQDRAVTAITPWIEVRGGVEWLCIPEGIGYPVTREPSATAQRG